jgi:DNA-binding NtrC family response regulator
MNNADSTIVVVNNSAATTDNLKALIEFMDTPQVCSAKPGEWRTAVGDRRVEAVFVGPDLNDLEVRSLVGDIGNLDPNIPIVMLSESEIE